MSEMSGNSLYSFLVAPCITTLSHDCICVHVTSLQILLAILISVSFDQFLRRIMIPCFYRFRFLSPTQDLYGKEIIGGDNICVMGETGAGILDFYTS